MSSYVIATTKSWNIKNAEQFADEFPEHDFTIVTRKEDLTSERMAQMNPKCLFFPHWSWHIPEDIYERYECVVFHMTDLPFGRGGSPLQNLIVRGIYHTKVSALRCGSVVDAGDIYFKEPVDISEGNVDEILSKISDIIFQKMIPHFIIGSPVCSPQEGEAVVYRRRTPQQSEIPEGLTQRQLYDYIRMLDGEGYPAAYQKYGDGKVYYRNARIEGDAVLAEAEFRDSPRNSGVAVS